MSDFTSVDTSTSTGTWLRIDPGSHNAPIQRVAVAADNSFFVTAGGDKRIKVWDPALTDGVPIHTLLGEIGPGSDGAIVAMALSPSPDHRVLAVVISRVGDHAERHLIRLYDTTTWTLAGAVTWTQAPAESDIHYTSQTRLIADMAFDPTGRFLITADRLIGADRADDIRSLEVRSVEQLLHAVGGAAPPPLASIPLDANPSRLAVSPTAGPTRIFVSPWGAHERTRNLFPIVVDLHTDSDADPRSDGDRPSLQPVDFAAAQDTTFPNLGLRPEQLAAGGGYLAVSNHDDGDLLIYDLDGNQRYALPDAGGGRPAELSFSPDGTRLIVGSKADRAEVTVHDVVDGFEIIGRRRYTSAAKAVGFISHDSDTAGPNEALSAGGPRYAIELWPSSTLEPTADSDRRVAGAGSIVTSVGIRGDEIAFGHPDAQGDNPLSRVFDLTDYCVRPYDADADADADSGPDSNARSGDDGPFVRARHEHDGARLDPPGADGNLYVRIDGEPDQPVSGLTNLFGWEGVESYGFLQSGRVITGGSAGNVRALRSHAPFNVTGRWLLGHTAAVRDLAADDRWLVTGGMDQVMRLWSIPDVEIETDSLADRSTALQPTLSLFVADDDEWVIWSPGGYYASSAGGDGLIAFHINQGEGIAARSVDSDRCAETLYRPDVIREILATGCSDHDLGLPVFDVTSSLPPEVELLDHSRPEDDPYTVVIRFRVRKGSAKTTRAWILHDGVLALEEAPPRPGTHERRLRLHPGENTFRLLAQSATAKATAVTFSVTAPTTDATEGGVTTASLGPVPVRRGITASGPELTLRLSTNAARETVELVTFRNDDMVGTTTVEAGSDDEIETSVPLVAGPNRIRVTATSPQGDEEVVSVQARLAPSDVEPIPEPNEDDEHGKGSEAAEQTSGKSEVSEVSIKGPPTKVDRNLYIVSIGVSDLKHSREGFKSLEFAHRDAAAIADKLAGGRLFGSTWKRTIQNERATRANIRRGLTELAKVTNKRKNDKDENNQVARDLTVLFFSGHGISVKNAATNKEELFLITHETDPDDIPGTALSIPDIGARLSALPTDVLLIVDACREGGVDGGIFGLIDPLQLEKRLREINEAALLLFFSASQNQKSFEFPQLGHGLFTHAILKELTEGGGGPIEYGQLTSGVKRRIWRSTASWTKKKQVPVNSSFNVPLTFIYS